MSAFEHRWLPIPPGALCRRLDVPAESKIAMDAIVEALNVDDVGGSGWKFAGMTPVAIIVVRERPPVGAMTAKEQAAAAEASTSPRKK